MSYACHYESDGKKYKRHSTYRRRRRNLHVMSSGVLASWILAIQTIFRVTTMSGTISFLEVVEISAFNILHHSQQQRHASIKSRSRLTSLLMTRPPAQCFVHNCFNRGDDNGFRFINNSFHNSIKYLPRQNHHRTGTLSVTNNMDIVDAEFIPIDDNSNKDENLNNNISSQPRRSATAIRSDKSLLDMSFELDDEFMNSRIPFIDTTVATDIGNRGNNADAAATAMTKNNYIDVKLAFMVTLDNVQYGIGIPYDTAAAITYEQPDGTIEYVSPDIELDGSGTSSDDDMTELIAIMATQLQEYIGTDVQLQHTPRVLTIAGNIDQYTKDWEKTLLPQAINATKLLDTLTNTAKLKDNKSPNDDDDDDSDDPELAFFHNLMREELGQAEYDKIMNDDNIDDSENEEMQELLKLFEVPFGTSTSSNSNSNSSNEEETMKELLSTLLSPEEDYENAKKAFGLLDPQETDSSGSMKNNTNGYMALKLISYMFANGKSYSLVQLLQPYVIVGKYILPSSSSSTNTPNNEDEMEEDNLNTYTSEDAMGYFELLLPEEEQIVIPRLEAVCSEDLQKANLQFQNKK
jgi:hypothetical protein